MKLLNCGYCHDIFSLTRKVRACTCGKSVGRYGVDGDFAVVWGPCRILAIRNDHYVQRWPDGTSLELSVYRDNGGKILHDRAILNELAKEEVERAERQDEPTVGSYLNDIRERADGRYVFDGVMLGDDGKITRARKRRPFARHN